MAGFREFISGAYSEGHVPNWDKRCALCGEDMAVVPGGENPRAGATWISHTGEINICCKCVMIGEVGKLLGDAMAEVLVYNLPYSPENTQKLLNKTMRVTSEKAEKAIALYHERALRKTAKR